MKQKPYLLIALCILLPIVMWISIYPQIRVKTVLCLGDSITTGYGSTDGQGYRTYLQRFLGDKYEVYGYSIMGGTTAAILEEVPMAIMKYKPDYVLYMAGTNDVDQKIPVIKSMRNVFFTIEHIREKSKAKIIICSIPDSTKFNVEEYNDWLMIVSHASKVRFEYINYELTRYPMNTSFDGVHPNDVGYLVMARAWYEAIKEE